MKLISLKISRIFLTSISTALLIRWLKDLKIFVPEAIHHISIVSATHYRKDDRGVQIFNLIQSQFEFRENNKFDKMAVLFLAGHKFRKKYKQIWCKSFNGTHQLQSTALPTVTSHPLPFCKWTLHIAVCNVVEQPFQFTIFTDDENQNTAIPYREAIRKQYDVVSCFSPLFLNEHWQLLLTGLEARRAHGLSLQVFYIQSIRAELMHILRIYERKGIVALEKWAGIDVGEESGLNYDPNNEIVWRNQEGAHTDCFLKYKASAKFIIISDVDDLLLPRIAPTYIQEFRSLLTGHNPSAIFYQRHDVDVFTSSSPRNFSIQNILHDAILRASVTGKHVAVTENVISVNLHWPGLNNQNEFFYVHSDVNIMYHLRNWFYDVQAKSRNDLMPLSKFIPNYKLMEYQRNFEIFMNATFRDNFEALYSKQLYFPLVEACYDEMFYSKVRSNSAITSCPGPIHCNIPKMPGVRCVNSHIYYEHYNLSSKLQIHLPVYALFVESNDGCKV